MSAGRQQGAQVLAGRQQGVQVLAGCYQDPQVLAGCQQGAQVLAARQLMDCQGAQSQKECQKHKGKMIESGDSP